MGIQLTLTDDDAMRYVKWLANIRTPRQETAEEESQQTEEAATGTEGPTAPTNLTTRRDELKDIRKWAAKHGFRIAAKGRIPQPVMDAYQKAHR